MEGVPSQLCIMKLRLAQGELLIAFTHKKKFLSVSYVSREKKKKTAWVRLDDMTYDHTQSYIVDGTVLIKKKKSFIKYFLFLWRKLRTEGPSIPCGIVCQGKKHWLKYFTFSAFALIHSPVFPPTLLTH